MEKTQTAVDWLVEHLTAIGHLEIPKGSNIVTAIISEAKEMEKEQIISAYNKSIPFKFGKEYYIETYGNKD